MADQPGSYGANIIVDLRIESFQDVVRAALSRQVQAVMADLETNYQFHRLDNPQAHGVQVSVNSIYNLRLLDSQADLDDQIVRRNQTDVAQETARLNSNAGGYDDETDQHDMFDYLDEEAFPNLPSSRARLLDSLPVVNLADLPEHSQTCPVCQESFARSDLNETDTPILLHCDHIIGRACIERWILGDHNSCPMCRAAIFEPTMLTALADQEGLRGHFGPAYYVRNVVARESAEERPRLQQQVRAHTATEASDGTS